MMKKQRDDTSDADTRVPGGPFPRAARSQSALVLSTTTTTTTTTSDGSAGQYNTTVPASMLRRTNSTLVTTDPSEASHRLHHHHHNGGGDNNNSTPRTTVAPSGGSTRGGDWKIHIRTTSTNAPLPHADRIPTDTDATDHKHHSSPHGNFVRHEMLYTSSASGASISFVPSSSATARPAGYPHASESHTTNDNIVNTTSSTGPWERGMVGGAGEANSEEPNPHQIHTVNETSSPLLSASSPVLPPRTSPQNMYLSSPAGTATSNASFTSKRGATNGESNAGSISQESDLATSRRSVPSAASSAAAAAAVAHLRSQKVQLPNIIKKPPSKQQQKRAMRSTEWMCAGPISTQPPGHVSFDDFDRIDSTNYVS